MARRPEPAPLGPALAGMIDETSYRIRLPELSDRELLHYDIAVLNPLDLDPRSDEAPPINQELSFIGEYKLANQAMCVFGHRHKHGFVFRGEDGVHYLVGNECGAKLMGAERWQEFRGRTEATKDRASYLRQIEALRAAFVKNRDWIVGLGKSKELSAFNKARSEFVALPGLAQACARLIARDGAQLTRTIRKRNFNAEAAREDRYERDIAHYNSKSEAERREIDNRGRKPALSKEHIYNDEQQNIGTLAGASLFIPKAPSAGTVAEIVKAIDWFIALNKIPKDRAKVKRMSENARSLVSNILNIRSAINDAIDFYDMENIERLLIWANEKRFNRLNYFAIPMGFRAIDESGERSDVIIRRLPELVRLNDPRFDELVQAGQAFAREFEPAGRAA